MHVLSIGDTKTVWKSISLIYIFEFSHWLIPKRLIGGSIKSFLTLNNLYSSLSSPYFRAICWNSTLKSVVPCLIRQTYEILSAS
jgi:hypothetical protein